MKSAREAVLDSKIHNSVTNHFSYYIVLLKSLFTKKYCRYFTVGLFSCRFPTCCKEKLKIENLKAIH